MAPAKSRDKVRDRFIGVVSALEKKNDSSDTVVGKAAGTENQACSRQKSWGRMSVSQTDRDGDEVRATEERTGGIKDSVL